MCVFQTRNLKLNEIRLEIIYRGIGPVDGQTRVSRSVITGQDENGKNIYENTSRMVSNRDLKSMMESYKSREKNSIRDALAQPAVHGTGEKPRTSDMQR